MGLAIGATEGRYEHFCGHAFFPSAGTRTSSGYHTRTSVTLIQYLHDHCDLAPRPRGIILLICS